MKTFETVWNDSEKVVSKIYQNSSVEDLSKLMIHLINEYNLLSKSDLPEEIKSSLKNRHIGEIVFLLSGITQKDNINVYSVLKNETSMNGDP